MINDLDGGDECNTVVAFAMIGNDCLQIITRKPSYEIDRRTRLLRSLHHPFFHEQPLKNKYLLSFGVCTVGKKSNVCTVQCLAITCHVMRILNSISTLRVRGIHHKESLHPNPPCHVRRRGHARLYDLIADG